ncbi:MAG: hypothetical protein JWP09_516 [Candidatus Taylorbacteria bacterium]|nr:hypothetical protein [Candidatus Taylorbacteria bacterium]
MLTTARKQIVEKVIVKDGVLFRVWFAVSNENGKIVATPIKAIKLGSVDENEIKVSLPTLKVKNVCNFAPQKSFVDKIVSPYSSLIFVSGSKPRAPTSLK